MEQKQNALDAAQKAVYKMHYSEEIVEEYLAKNPNPDTMLDPEEQKIEADLTMYREEKEKDIHDFLHRQNILINYKRNMCALKCHSNPDEDTSTIRECTKKCDRGEHRFNEFSKKAFGRGF